MVAKWQIKFVCCQALLVMICQYYSQVIIRWGLFPVGPGQ
jgi:hypothetical protein